VVPEGLKLWWETGVVDGGDQQHPELECVASLTLTPLKAQGPSQKQQGTA
jgi:hypothetical protein